MLRTTTSKTIELLWHMFAAYGNWSWTMGHICVGGVSSIYSGEHIHSSPYHQASNGFAERFVRTFKESMKAMKNENLSLNHNLENFMLRQRTTPQATTRQSPCALFLGRQVRTRLDS